jgi:hypothetical protein
MIAVMDPVVGTAIDPGELLAVYQDHYDSLVRLASLLLDDRSACEDVVQDAFVKTFLARSRLREAEKLPAYLRSAVLNGARSRLRRRQTARRHLTIAPEPQPSAELDAVLRDDQAAVLAAAARRWRSAGCSRPVRSSSACAETPPVIAPDRARPSSAACGRRGSAGLTAAARRGARCRCSSPARSSRSR